MKKILTALLALFVLMTAAGCSTDKGGSDETPKGFTPSLDTQTEARIIVAGSYSNFESLEAIFDDFNEIYPSVYLSYVKLDNYNNMIGTALSSEEAPNIYFTYSWMVGKDTYEQALSHAEILSDPALGLDLSVIREGLMNHDENGNVIMVPVFATTNGVLVNEDLFEKEGLKIPTTYSELLEVCGAFKEKGYSSPIMGYNGSVSSTLFNGLVYSHFCGVISDDRAAVDKLNRMDPSAGEYMRPSLEIITELIDKGYVDVEQCNAMQDSYTEVILRFFEGDVPMMVCTGDTASGTKKRESQSEAFTANPFTYSFMALPTTDKGAYLLDSPSVQFSVNKDCNDLEMTNEFMRFLVSTQELNKMSEIKRLVTPTSDFTYDSVYASLGNIPADMVVLPESMGITDDTATQFRRAVYKVSIGELTIDEAIAQYGQLE